MLLILLSGYNIGISRFADMTSLVSLGKALSDVNRIRIVAALLQEELCVCELVDALELSQSTVSTHLQTLRSSGLVATDRRRNWIIYRIDPSAVDALRSLFSQLPPRGDRIEEDRRRLESRIRLRVDGCCTQGIGALDSLEEELVVS